MLSFALKIVWFTLSLSGLISCWLVLGAFSREVRSYWAPILYCVGCTMLQGIFCISLAWKMDPFIVPKAFCIAQTIIIGFSTFLMTGVCTALSLAAATHSANSLLIWKHVYLLPIVVFPLLATASQILVVVRLDAVQPSDDLYCDASSPIWVRFLGYAGTPFILLIPSFIISILTITRVRTLTKQSQDDQTFTTNSTHTPFTSLPLRQTRSRGALKDGSTLTLSIRAITAPTPPPNQQNLSPGRAPIRPGFASPALSAQKFHLPFSPPHSHLDGGSSARSSTAPDLDMESLVSDVPEEGEDGWRDENESGRLSSLRWARGPGDEIGEKSNFEDFDFDGQKVAGKRREGESESWDGEFVVLGTPELLNQPHQHYMRRSPLSTMIFHSPIRSRSPPTDTGPILWRIIIFQIFFASVVALASISTIIDVASRHTSPMPFGTHHVALLLTAWGPAIIFGSLPSVQSNLFFWRHR